MSASWSAEGHRKLGSILESGARGECGAGMAGRGVRVSQTRRARDIDPGSRERPPMPIRTRSELTSKGKNESEPCLVLPCYVSAFLSQLDSPHSSCRPPRHARGEFPAAWARSKPAGFTPRNEPRNSTYREGAPRSLTCPSYALYHQEASSLSVLLSLPPPTGQWGKALYRVLGNVGSGDSRSVRLHALPTFPSPNPGGRSGGGDHPRRGAIWDPLGSLKLVLLPSLILLFAQ